MPPVLSCFHLKMPLLPHPHPNPPLEGGGTKKFSLLQERVPLFFFLSLRERIKVRVGLIFILLCEQSSGMFHKYSLQIFVLVFVFSSQINFCCLSARDNGFQKY